MRRLSLVIENITHIFYYSTEQYTTNVENL